MKGPLSFLAGLLYPRRCVFCREFLDKTTEEDICPSCPDTLPWTKADFRTRGDFFTVCFSPLYYEGRAAEAVRRLKFRGGSAGAATLGRLIGRFVAEKAPNAFTLVTWVPLSARGLRRRGYCQAELLARAAAEVLQLPCRALLKKRRHTPPQSGLRGAAARRANVSGAFQALQEDAIAGQQILLLDDVITTGSTLTECARMLLMAGAQSVRCATLCKTKKRKTAPRAASAAAQGTGG